MTLPRTQTPIAIAEPSNSWDAMVRAGPIVWHGISLDSWWGHFNGSWYVPTKVNKTMVFNSSKGEVSDGFHRIFD